MGKTLKEGYNEVGDLRGWVSGLKSVLPKMAERLNRRVDTNE